MHELCHAVGHGFRVSIWRTPHSPWGLGQVTNHTRPPCLQTWCRVACGGMRLARQQVQRAQREAGQGTRRGGRSPVVSTCEPSCSQPRRLCPAPPDQGEPWHGAAGGIEDWAREHMHTYSAAPHVGLPHVLGMVTAPGPRPSRSSRQEDAASTRAPGTASPPLPAGRTRLGTAARQVGWQGPRAAVLDLGLGAARPIPCPALLTCAR